MFWYFGYEKIVFGWYFKTYKLYVFKSNPFTYYVGLPELYFNL